MPQSQQALMKLCSKDLCSTAGLVWDSWLGHWGAEPWQWFICQCTTLTAKSGREQVRNKRAEGRYLGLKLFWKFLIKNQLQNKTKKTNHCVVSKATYTGLQQGAKSFIFKAVITDKNRSAIFFSPLENRRQIRLLIWFHHSQETTSIIGPLRLALSIFERLPMPPFSEKLCHYFKIAAKNSSKIIQKPIAKECCM